MLTLLSDPTARGLILAGFVCLIVLAAVSRLLKPIPGVYQRHLDPKDHSAPSQHFSDVVSETEWLPTVDRVVPDRLNTYAKR